MDGATRQGRIYTGYGKAAARIGSPYSQYRAASPIDPIVPGNLIGTVDCFFGPNPNFVLPHKFKIPARALYADGNVLAQRDILVGAYGTFYVGDKQPMLPMQMVLCNDTVSVARHIYVGTALVPHAIVSGMPAFKQLKQVGQTHPQFGASNDTTSIGEWWLYLPIAPGTVIQGDTLTDRFGKIYTIDTIDHTEMGVVLTIRQADAT